jgi:hypothetical protein
MQKKEYQSPRAELHQLCNQLTVLVNFSSEAEIGDWEDDSNL